jgi:hypothetical protein
MDEPLDAMVNQAPPISSSIGRSVHEKIIDSSSTLASAQASAERVWAAVNRNPRRVFSALIALYLAIACGQGASKLLWCDELITLAIARQGSLAAIWRALAAGADPNPPLSHWLVLQSTRTLGDSALAVRLPVILCVLLAIVSLWIILRRWVSPGYAAVGVLAFMATRGFDYAYDARSYAPLMGFAMASLALWLASCDAVGSHPAWRQFATLASMALALALGLSSNYYGVLAFFPIALGEAVLTLRTRRLRFGVWIAMTLAALPLLAFLPLIRHNIAEFTPHAWNRPQAGMIVDSYLELVEGVFWPVLGLGLFAAWRCWRRPTRRTEQPRPSLGSTLKPHEIAALSVLIFYPVLGLLIASAGAGMVSPRCVVPVCCGFGIAAALLASRIFGASSRAGIIALSIALVWVVARESACAFILSQQRAAFFALRDEVARQPSSQSIVVGDSLFVLPLAHYSAPDVRARIVFPIDFDAIHRFEPDDSGEQNLWAGRAGLFPIRIVAYDTALFAGQDIALIARPTGWLAQSLTRDGFNLGQTDDNPAWQDLGGVFTPLAHEDTRLFRAHQ